ncbi:MAG TPA: DUF1552 domain-containing protein [Bryobacteraceae bacterium]|jgi:hypothetical protein
MFITKKHIHRRTFLRGAGVTLALPLLDSMIPAQTPLSKTAAVRPTRFMGIFVPHGMAPGYWIPESPKLESGKMLSIMEPLDKVVDADGKLVHESFLDQTVILSGMWTKSAEPPPGVTGADHWVAAAFMSAKKPKKATGADIMDGITIDQLIAQKIGRESLVPSLQMAIEDPGANSSNCGEGYSCAYTNSISWAPPSIESKDYVPGSSNQPLPMELNPQIIFEKLFGDVQAKTPEERAARREEDRSILDSVSQSLARFKMNLPNGDRHKVDEFTEDIREIERRLDNAKKSSGVVTGENVVVPAGIPESFDEHIKLHFDLTALGFRNDTTRVATMLYARDLTGRNFPASGTNTSFHGGSHHAENPDRIKDYSKINRYHVQCLAYFLDKLRSTPDGDGNLLDHSLTLYGTNMGDSNQHLHYDVPHILAGGASGQLKGGRHLAFPTKTITTGNMLLSILDLYGIHQESIGDSTGRLPGLV